MNAFAWRLRRVFVFLLGAALLAGSWFAVSLHAAEKTAEDKTAAAQAQAEQAVREALQREVYGLDTDREALLSAALSSAPDLDAARWQQGYVRAASGQWLKADDTTNKKRQSLLNQYDKLRGTYEDTIASQLALADWCSKQGLKDQERVHLLRVCELAPDHPIARQRAGFARVGREWISKTELEKAQAREVAAQKALAYWTPVITKLAAQLASNDLSRRQAAEAQLREIRDPAALPALESILAVRGEDEELLVVAVMARMSDPEAVVALARRAVFSPNLFVRDTAARKLQACPHDHYVPLLISSMYTPVISRMEAVALPNGRIGYRHEFLREGAERQEHLVLDTEYRRRAAPGSNGAQSLIMAATEANNTAAQLERAATEQNAATKKLNDRLGWVLTMATGVDLPAVPEDWWTWWNDQNEVFVEGTKPITTVQVSRSVSVVESTGGGRQDCLAAGTPVWTARGTVAIEKIRAGDLVLSRDVESGELAFKPVLRTTIRPAGKLVQIQADNEMFETSGGHLFWVSGQGWVKSRQLETGMVLHTAGGPARVTHVGAGATAPTYNLVVADFNTYFVGERKLLSHDNTVRRPTNVVVPGLRPE